MAHKELKFDTEARRLEEPIRQISEKAGADGSILVERVRSQGDSVGFNALTGEYEDLVVAGVIDPAMVTRNALQNAASIGGTHRHHRGGGRRARGGGPHGEARGRPGGTM